MFVLDFFIVNVALPSIQQGLRAGESAIEWIVAGYGISTAVMLVTGGRLGDQFGRRRVFALGMALFVVTSAAVRAGGRSGHAGRGPGSAGRRGGTHGAQHLVPGPALTVRFGRRVIAIGAVLAAAGDAALYLAPPRGPVACGVPRPAAARRLAGAVHHAADHHGAQPRRPATAGSVSGALSTAQQVGNSIGVAVTGVLFFGALHHGYGLAFERSVLQMGALLLVVAALSRLMPGRQETA